MGRAQPLADADDMNDDLAADGERAVG